MERANRRKVFTSAPTSVESSKTLWKANNGASASPINRARIIARPRMTNTVKKKTTMKRGTSSRLLDHLTSLCPLRAREQLANFLHQLASRALFVQTPAQVAGYHTANRI